VSRYLSALSGALVAAVSVGILALGCSSGKTADTSDGGEAGVAGTLPCAVDDVLARRCRTCHGKTPSFGAPMSLVTYADLQAPAKSDPTQQVYQLVLTRIHDDAAPMPQPPNPRLVPDDMTTLDDWIAANAPSGDGSACPDAGVPDAAPSTLSCTPDVALRPAAAWAMPTDQQDIYVCYGVDVPVTGSRQVIAFQPRIDNTRIVHHVLLYESTTAISTTPFPCSGTSVRNKLLYGWAPGGQAFELPDVAGYPMGSGTAHYMVQVHYNNITALSGQTDSTGFDICTTDQLRPNAADIVAFGSLNFTIPAHGSLDITCDWTLPATRPAYNVISAFPHMHQLGKAIRTTATTGDAGAPIDLGGVDSWSFSNQVWFPLTAQIHPGDTVHTRCAWDNTTDTAVTWGEYTENEMCFSFTMYYPADPAVKSWIGPSLNSQCQPTPP
jgi:hypothetical protein